MPDDFLQSRRRSRVATVTPHDPAGPLREPASRERASASGHLVRTTPWVRLEAAVASVRGKRREVNEDWHSALDGDASLFVVADGGGGGAMAARASGELGAQLH